jgi:hypothetical protein
MYVEIVPGVSKVSTGSPAFVHKSCGEKLMICIIHRRLFIIISAIILRFILCDDHGVLDSILTFLVEWFSMATKRARVSPPSVENILRFARSIMNDDPFKEVAPKEEDERFRALFWCPPDVCIVEWYKLLRSDLIPEQGTMVHLLCTLMYCKTTQNGLL